MGVMNELINRENVEMLAKILGEAAPGSHWPHVVASASELDPLSMRARTDVVSGALLADLRLLPDPGYPTAARAFRSALTAAGFTGWILWPVSEAAVALALEAGSGGDPGKDFDDSLALLAELTPRLTGEFAVRRLLAADLERSLQAILGWTAHPDEHVRRLASEGTRPYLPWAVRVPGIVLAPEATIPLLIKNAHPGALALLGFVPASLAVNGPRLDRDSLALPGELAFDFEISNTGPADARLAVDYVVHYVKANGTRSAKVFKIGALTLSAGETRSVTKRHAFRQMTTRVHHAGVHALELQINGMRRHGRTEFKVHI